MNSFIKKLAGSKPHSDSVSAFSQQI